MVTMATNVMSGIVGAKESEMQGCTSGTSSTVIMSNFTAAGKSDNT
jgi:hypothetical protein